MNSISAPRMLNVLLIVILGTSYMSAQSQLLESTNVFLYHGPTINDASTVYPLSEAVNIVPDLDSNLDNVLYIHSYRENQTRESVQTVVNAFLASGEFNVLTFDWSQIAIQPYPSIVFQYFDPLTEKLANALIEINNAGLNVKDLYMVGFSLGAQIAGRCGDILQSNNIIFERITGLDPAGMYFSKATFTLNSNCAKFVDIIHTDMGYLGSSDIVGHADFLPNCGKRFQPFCRSTISKPITPDAICSHNMAWRYFSESISNTNFIGLDSIANKEEIMGLQCSSTARGTFYLTTNAAKPFARGTYGLSTGSNCDIPCVPILT